MSKIAFSPAERHSAAWAKIEEYAQNQLNILRKKNDNPDLDPTKTAILRGQIKEIKSILAFGEVEPEFKSASSNSSLS